MTKHAAANAALLNANVAAQEGRWIDAAAAYTFVAAECDKQNNDDFKAAAIEYREAAATCIAKWEAA